MKILVLQLARLGDIYMTWPVMRAIKRLHPSAELHFLTRPRFEAAVQGLTVVDRHWVLPSSEILSPLIQNQPDTDLSLQKLSHFVDSLAEQKFDWIINFTFSPFSSYLTHVLSSPQTRVNGYTRYDDGSLRFGDELSAYFYAQVGIGKPNRVHVTDLFASMIDIEFVPEDWADAEIVSSSHILPSNYFAIHVGASERHKALSAEKWTGFLTKLRALRADFGFVLIGASGEKSIADEIARALPADAVVNLVGLTQVPDLFDVIRNAEILIGCDSAPIHIASLTDTPTFNISLGNVNFWETGPKASLAFIHQVAREENIQTSLLAQQVHSLLQGKLPSGLVVRSGGLASYEVEESTSASFQWRLVQALYLGAAYPVAERMEIVQGAMKLNEINSFAMEQLALVATNGVAAIAPFLERAEEVIESISRLVPELSPLISWYQAEKVRIGPGSIEEVCAATLSVHERLGRHLHVYIPQEEINDEEVGHGAL